MQFNGVLAIHTFLLLLIWGACNRLQISRERTPKSARKRSSGDKAKLLAVPTTPKGGRKRGSADHQEASAVRERDSFKRKSKAKKRQASFAPALLAPSFQHLGWDREAGTAAAASLRCLGSTWIAQFVCPSVSRLICGFICSVGS